MKSLDFEDIRGHMKLITFTGILLALSAGIVAAGGHITIKGSDTLVRLGQRWAEEYMNTNPEVVIGVSGGGSGAGIAALINGGTDICEASRDMKAREYQLAERKGIQPYRVSVALDGIAVFLNEKNSVHELSFAQLKGIYTGTITNWKEVGGADARIIIYGRENNSGTYTFFKKRVMNQEDYNEYTQTLPGTAAVVNAVSMDANGIGYGGIAWATRIKFAAVRKSDSSPAVIPTPETVSSGEYPISRDLYWFFDGKPSGELKKFLNWALSEIGQEVAADMDYIPLPRERALAQMME